MTNKEKVEAQKELGIIPQAKDVFGRRLEGWKKRVDELAQNKAAIKVMEARNRELTGELVEYFADSEHKTVMDNTTKVTLSFGKHTSINKERLLANGVTADIILASTKETTYEYINITPAKEKE